MGIGGGSSCGGVKSEKKCKKAVKKHCKQFHPQDLKSLVFVIRKTLQASKAKKVGPYATMTFNFVP